MALTVALSLVLHPHKAKAEESVTATWYGPGLEGNTLACGGTFHSSDPSVVAVPLSRDREFPCGALLEISGPNGSLTVIRQDTCGECSPRVFDLSRAASEIVCGLPAHTCLVTVGP